MGQEIASSQFNDEDFIEFKRRLEAETRLLSSWFSENLFANRENFGGFELEACLLDRAAAPAPYNQELLEGLDEPLIVPELATFNVEFNSLVRPLVGDVFSRMAAELESLWSRCNGQAAKRDMRLGMIGILPTLEQQVLSLVNMSPLNRYRALNEQIFRLRRGRSVNLDIQGREHLVLEHEDVMLESAATSFQIHLQVNPSQAAKLYNLSKIVSAPMVAMAANSPFLFGRDLWDETRIPLFEQAIAVGASDLTKRVSFGIRYLHASMQEIFEANLLRYPVLLPLLMDEPPEKLAHLSLHNGTIWRWNRPLIGFDHQARPHLRIEHRVVPAGPSVMDAIANAAFYFGLVTGLLRRYQDPELKLPFESARRNFYAAARWGLRAEIVWFDGERASLKRLITDSLLPSAREGLLGLGVDPTEVDHWLGIVSRRVALERNGAAWQREWVKHHGSDFHALMQDYLMRQESGRPVHEWPV